jgi:hypothetical protein
MRSSSSTQVLVARESSTKTAGSGGEWMLFLPRIATSGQIAVEVTWRPGTRRRRMVRTLRSYPSVVAPSITIPEPTRRGAKESSSAARAAAPFAPHPAVSTNPPASANTPLPVRMVSSVARVSTVRSIWIRSI